MNNDTCSQMPRGLDVSALHKFEVDLPDGQLFYLPNWLSASKADALYAALSDEIAWSQDSVFVYGKWYLIPRLQAWYGDSETAYQYSGKMLQPLSWTSTLNHLRSKVQQLGVPVNSVLANWYRTGLDKMGWHSDNEKELGSRPTIASLSLGATRSFHLKHKSTGQRIDLELSSGSLLLMAGALQKNWQHSLPQRKRIVDGRINLTFRHVQQTL